MRCSAASPLGCFGFLLSLPPSSVFYFSSRLKLMAHEYPELRDENLTLKTGTKLGNILAGGRRGVGGTESLSAAWPALTSWTQQWSLSKI